MTRRAECVRCEVEAQWGFTRPAVERVPARPSTKLGEKCRTHLTQSRAWLVYSTATSLDGFIIDDHDSLTWLFATPDHSGDPTAATATPTPFSSTRSCRQSARWCWAPTAMSGSSPSSLLPRPLRLQRRNVERDGQFTALLFDVVGPEPIAEHGHASGLLGAMDEAQSTRR